MAGVRDNRLATQGPWPLGVNNVADENALPTDEFGARVALREADNLDLTAEGWPRTRPGSEQVAPGTLMHSLWADPAFAFGLLVDDGMLCRVDPTARVQALGIAVGNLPLSYTRINDRIYFSNATHCGMVLADGTIWPWAPEQPSGQPALATLPGSALAPGLYQVAVTFLDALGRESGSTFAAAIEVPENSELVLTEIPQPQDPIATPTVQVYCTDANDPVLRRALSLPAGITTATIFAPATGISLPSQFLRPMPPGQIVRTGHGRQWVARGREVLWSEPLWFGMTRATNRIRFDDTVMLLEPVGDGAAGGVYVAAGHRTYWMAGNTPADFNQRFVMSCGIVPGSALRIPGVALGIADPDDQIVWLARNGKFCVGAPNGQVITLKDNEAAIDNADRAAVLFREQDGLRQLIAALKGPRRNGLAVSDRPIARVIHEDA